MPTKRTAALLVTYAIVKKVKGKCSDSVPYAQTALLTATGPLTG